MIRFFLFILLLSGLLFVQCSANTPPTLPLSVDPDEIRVQSLVSGDPISQYHELTGKDEQEITRLMLNGLLSADSGQHFQAIEFFSRVLEIDPGYTDAWYYSGMSHYYLNQSDAAMSAFYQTIRTDPDYYHAWYGISLVYHQKGEIWNQSAAISKALEIKDSLEEKEDEIEDKNTPIPSSNIPDVPLTLISVIFGCIGAGVLVKRKCA